MNKEAAVDYLQADTVQIPGQRYALISVVSPTSKQRNEMCGVKIRGVFDDIESAKIQAKKIQSNDPLFDVYLVELYKWLPIPPDKECIESQEYQDEVLNTIIGKHAEEQMKAKAFFEQRKTDVSQGNLEPNDFMENS